MDTKRVALKAVRVDSGAPTAPESLVSDAVDGLAKKFDLMIRLMDDQVHLQKVSLLDAGHILRFFGPEGQPIALSLPDAQEDYIQRVILRSRTFYEARLLQAIRDTRLVNRTSTVCDIGANIGNHTIYFGKILGAARVLSYEPQLYCHGTLCANIELNGLVDRVIAYNCMLGAQTGNGSLMKFNPKNIGSSMFQPDEAGDVAMFALDDAISVEDLANLDLIKIDVEGMQMQVLAGAEGVISEKRPAIWVEILERGESVAEANEFLGRFGYRGEQLAPNNYLYRV